GVGCSNSSLRVRLNFLGTANDQPQNAGARADRRRFRADAPIVDRIARGRPGNHRGRHRGRSVYRARPHQSAQSRCYHPRRRDGHMDGLTFLRKIMALRPMPVVMVSTLTQSGAETTLEALEVGAVDFIAKPAQERAERLTELADELQRKVKAAAQVRV